MLKNIFKQNTAHQRINPLMFRDILYSHHFKYQNDGTITKIKLKNKLGGMNDMGNRKFSRGVLMRAGSITDLS
jgi:hypothetical protein